MNDSDLIEIVLSASPVVKTVMILLAAMSVAVWAVAFAKSYQVRKVMRETKAFEKTFWSKFHPFVFLAPIPPSASGHLP